MKKGTARIKTHLCKAISISSKLDHGYMKRNTTNTDRASLTRSYIIYKEIMAKYMFYSQ